MFRSSSRGFAILPVLGIAAILVLAAVGLQSLAPHSSNVPAVSQTATVAANATPAQTTLATCTEGKDYVLTISPPTTNIKNGATYYSSGNLPKTGINGFTICLNAQYITDHTVGSQKTPTKDVPVQPRYTCSKDGQLILESQPTDPKSCVYNLNSSTNSYTLDGPEWQCHVIVVDKTVTTADQKCRILKPVPIGSQIQSGKANSATGGTPSIAISTINADGTPIPQPTEVPGGAPVGVGIGDAFNPDGTCKNPDANGNCPGTTETPATPPTGTTPSRTTCANAVNEGGAPPECSTVCYYDSSTGSMSSACSGTTTAPPSTSAPSPTSCAKASGEGGLQGCDKVCYWDSTTGSPSSACSATRTSPPICDSANKDSPGCSGQPPPGTCTNVCQPGQVLQQPYYCVTSIEPVIVIPLKQGDTFPPNCYNNGGANPVPSQTFPQQQGPYNQQQQHSSGNNNPLSSLGSALSKLLGLGQPPPPPPRQQQQQPQAPQCSSDPNAYAQQQQQYQQQLQQYNYQLQQYQYQQQLNQYNSQQGYAPQPPQPQPIQPQQCTPSSGNQCQLQLQQPPPAANCSAGSWQPVMSGACVSNWQCIPNTALQAQLSCQPQVADVGMTLAISYSCSAGIASGNGFTVTTQPAGSATTTVGTPPAGANTATYSLTCTNQGQTVGAQCSVQISRSSIILVANPKTVQSGVTSQLGWITTGMQSCVISSPDQSDFTSRNAYNTSPNGTAVTSPITSTSTFLLHCLTTGGISKDATTTVSVGN